MTSANLSCVACGARLLPDASFCSACGHQQPVEAEFTEVETGHQDHRPAQALRPSRFDEEIRSPRPPIGLKGANGNPATQSVSQPPWYRQLWPWVLMAAVLLLVSLFVLGAAADEQAAEQNATTTPDNSAGLRLVEEPAANASPPAAAAEGPQKDRVRNQTMIDLDEAQVDTIPPDMDMSVPDPKDQRSGSDTPPDTFAPPPPSPTPAPQN